MGPFEFERRGTVDESLCVLDVMREVEKTTSLVLTSIYETIESNIIEIIHLTPFQIPIHIVTPILYKSIPDRFDGFDSVA